MARTDVINLWDLYLKLRSKMYKIIGLLKLRLSFLLEKVKSVKL